MRVLVLFGGISDEREVSKRSGQSVADALRESGHEVLEYDPVDGYDGLSRFAGKVDCAFPILHGKGGEDGIIQEELEKRGIKYLGAGSKASKICFDKVEFKKILNKSSISVPGGELVSKESIEKSELIKKPYVLKPVNGGSSVDTHIIRDPSRSSYDPDVFYKYKQMLLEELIYGTEITVPILGDSALPVIEIIPPVGGEFDYDNKYNGATQEICPPKNVPSDIQIQAKRLSEKVHKITEVRHLSRTDIIIDKDMKLWVLELNTIPGMTDQSLFPKAAEVAGISMGQLVNKFVELALAR